MKIYLTLLVLTLLCSFYSWAYDNYLHESTYIAHLPNYKEDVPSKIYDGKTGQVANLADHPMCDDLLSYVPWYGRLLYRMAQVVLFAAPLLFFVTLPIGIFMCCKKTALRSWKMIIFQSVAFMVCYACIWQTLMTDQ